MDSPRKLSHTVTRISNHIPVLPEDFDPQPEMSIPSSLINSGTAM
ncbi:MAG: hypothetical protein R2741_14625 [Methanolobus sp.]